MTDNEEQRGCLFMILGLITVFAVIFLLFKNYSGVSINPDEMTVEDRIEHKMQTGSFAVYGSASVSEHHCGDSKTVVISNTSVIE